jgi:hypothetical protein
MTCKRYQRAKTLPHTCTADCGTAEPFVIVRPGRNLVHVALTPAQIGATEFVTTLPDIRSNLAYERARIRAYLL